jgi:hypothetical protein
MSRLKLGNVCCHSVKNILFSHLPYETNPALHYFIISFVVLYGCETLCHKEEQKLDAFRNRVLRRIFVYERKE